MTIRKLFAIAAVTLAVSIASQVTAHEAAKGPNGGLRVDAGKFHTELVADGTTRVVVFLGDMEQRAIPATGFKGNAILIVDGKAQRFSLEFTEGSQLVGTAPVAIPIGVKGAIQVTAPDGSTGQGKF
jgi:hypothetical protein